MSRPAISIPISRSRSCGSSSASTTSASRWSSRRHDVHLIDRFGARRIVLEEGRGRVAPHRPSPRRADMPTALNTWLARHAQTLVGSLGRIVQHPVATTHDHGGHRARARAAAVLQRAAAKHARRDGRLESGVRALGVSHQEGRHRARRGARQAAARAPRRRAGARRSPPTRRSRSFASRRASARRSICSTPIRCRMRSS